ncbi:MAG: hypothetical protein Fur007_18330 [Rhodoferax sp.]
MLDLARSFRRSAIAEGVETAAHARMLLRLGCELAQGYGIARPMPAGQVPAWVQQWRPDPEWAALQPLARRHQPILFACAELRAWVRALRSHLQDDARPAPAPLPADWARALLVDGLVAQAHDIDLLHIQPLLTELQAQAANRLTHARQGDRAAALQDWAEMEALIEALQAHLLALLPGQAKR